MLLPLFKGCSLEISNTFYFLAEANGYLFL